MLNKIQFNSIQPYAYPEKKTPTSAVSLSICPLEDDTETHETMDASKEGRASAYKCRKCRHVVFHATHLSALQCITTSASVMGDGTAILQR